jgi:site-specific recombinase XerD
MRVERRFAAATIKCYLEGPVWFIRLVGDVPVSDLNYVHILQFKARLDERRVGPSRVSSHISGLKCLLQYCESLLGIQVLDPKSLRLARSPRRAVVYLTDEEVSRLLEYVPLHTFSGKPRLVGFRLRALLETLFATGMRIAECLSLNRDSIDSKRSSALIVGKGSKPRSVFFTPRSLEWLGRYLALRPDNSPPLFANDDGTRLSPRALQSLLRRHAKSVGIAKRVTPHILRHTLATHLLKNGCPIGAIKEILGHNRLETTCRFYLGTLSADEAQRMHDQFIRLQEHAPSSITNELRSWPCTTGSSV